MMQQNNSRTVMDCPYNYITNGVHHQDAWMTAALDVFQARSAERQS